MKVIFITPSQIRNIPPVDLHFPLSVGDEISQVTRDRDNVELVVVEVKYVADTANGEFSQSVRVELRKAAV